MVINDDLKISGPVHSEKTICVRFNFELNQFEGLPKVWRELLEMPEQQNEVEEIDESFKINREKLLIADAAKFTVYEVHPNYNGSNNSFIITATNRVDKSNTGSS